MGIAGEALTMPAAYFLLILREYGKTARERAALVAGTGLRETDLARGLETIPLGAQLREIRNANRLLAPGWALAMGARFHAAAHGAVGFAAVSAPTLAKSLEVMARFGSSRSPHFRLRVRTGGREVRLVVEDLVELDEEERVVLVDLVLLSAQWLVESVIGRPMREGRFELSYPAPPHAALYPEYFHGPVRFGAREAAIVIPRVWLGLESPLADRAMYEASLRSLERAADDTLSEIRFLPARVEQLIGARDPALGVDAAARALGLSTRTLMRRLREAGTSYRALAAASQQRRAISLLRDRRLSVAEVAWALGYQDAANFGRACRRWFGVSPGRYRAIASERPRRRAATARARP